ncbi:unnamed protein product [Choristocarpus tenellus]
MVSALGGIGGRLPAFTEEESELLRRSWDFLGVNYYTSRYVRHMPSSPQKEGLQHEKCTSPALGAQSMTCEVEGWEFDMGAKAEVRDFSGNLIGPRGGTEWEYAYPTGLRSLLRWVDQRYRHPPIYIFENGASETGEEHGGPGGEENRGNDHRIWYLREHLRSVEEAMSLDGVDLRGYFYWSLCDNFEWNDGYSIRFGLVHVDYTQGNLLKRTPRQSAQWFADFVAHHRWKLDQEGTMYAGAHMPDEESDCT